MPIDNTIIGAWKTVVFKDASGEYRKWIVSDYRIRVSQGLSSSYAVIGSPRANIINVDQAFAEISLSAPLIVSNNVRNSYNEINDGLALWYNFIRNNYTWRRKFADPGIIVNNASCSISSNGITYNMSFICDVNNLYNEFQEMDDIERPELYCNDHYVSDYGNFALEENYYYRTANYYDVDSYIILKYQESPIYVPGYIDNFNINISLNNNKFLYIGQPSQRSLIYNNNIEITYSGSLVVSNKNMAGYQFPWQAMNNVGVDTFGGSFKYLKSEVEFYLRKGLPNNEEETDKLKIIPNVNIDNVEMSIIGDSSFNVSSGLIKLQFDGRMIMSGDDIFPLTPEPSQEE